MIHSHVHLNEMTFYEIFFNFDKIKKINTRVRFKLSMLNFINFIYLSSDFLIKIFITLNYNQSLCDSLTKIVKRYQSVEPHKSERFEDELKALEFWKIKFFIS